MLYKDFRIAVRHCVVTLLAHLTHLTSVPPCRHLPPSQPPLAVPQKQPCKNGRRGRHDSGKYSRGDRGLRDLTTNEKTTCGETPCGTTTSGRNGANRVACACHAKPSPMEDFFFKPNIASDFSELITQDSLGMADFAVTL